MASKIRDAEYVARGNLAVAAPTATTTHGLMHPKRIVSGDHRFVMEEERVCEAITAGTAVATGGVSGADAGRASHS